MSLDAHRRYLHQLYLFRNRLTQFYTKNLGNATKKRKIDTRPQHIVPAPEPILEPILEPIPEPILEPIPEPIYEVVPEIVNVYMMINSANIDTWDARDAILSPMVTCTMSTDPHNVTRPPNFNELLQDVIESPKNVNSIRMLWDPDNMNWHSDYDTIVLTKSGENISSALLVGSINMDSLVFVPLTHKIILSQYCVSCIGKLAKTWKLGMK